MSTPDNSKNESLKTVEPIQQAKTLTDKRRSEINSLITVFGPDFFNLPSKERSKIVSDEVDKWITEQPEEDREVLKNMENYKDLSAWAYKKYKEDGTILPDSSIVFEQYLKHYKNREAQA